MDLAGSTVVMYSEEHGNMVRIAEKLLLNSILTDSALNKIMKG